MEIIQKIISRELLHLQHSYGAQNVQKPYVYIQLFELFSQEPVPHL